MSVEYCTSCGAPVKAQAQFCTGCGALRSRGAASTSPSDDATTRRSGAGGSPQTQPTWAGGASPNPNSRTWMVVGGVGLAVVIVVFLAFVMLGRGGSSSPVAAPVESSSAPAAAQPTVTVTAAAPAPTVAASRASATDVAGSWSGTMTAGRSVYVADLELSESADGSLSGTMTNTSESSHNRGTYRVSGYRQGSRIVLNGTGWVSRPNNQWFMDHLDVTYSSPSTMSGTFSPVDDPSSYTGDVRLRRG